MRWNASGRAEPGGAFGMDTMRRTCETCAYFLRHYVKCKKRYHATGFGHCIEPRIKVRKLDTPACARYKQREEAQTASR